MEEGSSDGSSASKKRKSRRSCAVPMCTNTTRSTPDKFFFSLPPGEDIRKKWCKAMKRDEMKLDPLSFISGCSICDDHFNLAEDLENYWQFTLMKNVRPRLKKSVVPRLFACQELITSATVARPDARKRRKNHIVVEALSGYETCPLESAASSSSLEHVQSGMIEEREMKIIIKKEPVISHIKIETTEACISESAASFHAIECVQCDMLEEPESKVLIKNELEISPIKIETAEACISESETSSYSLEHVHFDMLEEPENEVLIKTEAEIFPIKIETTEPRISESMASTSDLEPVESDMIEASEIKALSKTEAEISPLETETGEASISTNKITFSQSVCSSIKEENISTEIDKSYTGTDWGYYFGEGS